MGLSAASSHAGLIPLVSAPGATGSGLAGSWYKVDDSALFSNYVYQGQAIKNYGWGTGIWSISDLAQIQANTGGIVQGTASTVSAVSFANGVYNRLAGDGDYGSWNLDYVRPLAPVVGALTGSCKPEPDALECQQWNYAAVFSGYIYIGTSGFYDLGIFADDGFSFTLRGGNNQSLNMQMDSVADGPGRGSYSLADSQGAGGGIELQAGYYGIDLSYYNRLEAGVIDFGIKPWDGFWETVSEEQLFTSIPGRVPEPGSTALLALGLAGLWISSRRHAAARR